MTKLLVKNRTIKLSCFAWRPFSPSNTINKQSGGILEIPVQHICMNIEETDFPRMCTRPLYQYSFSASSRKCGLDKEKKTLMSYIRVVFWKNEFFFLLAAWETKCRLSSLNSIQWTTAHILKHFEIYTSQTSFMVKKKSVVTWIFKPRHWQNV